MKYQNKPIFIRRIMDAEHVSFASDDQFATLVGQDFVQKFACWTKATLTEEWAENVTHVVLGKGAGTSWSRSFEVLMAILLGKWVVHFEC